MNTSDTSWYRAQYECSKKNAILLEIFNSTLYPDTNLKFDTNNIQKEISYWIGGTNEQITWTIGIYILLIILYKTKLKYYI